VGLRLLLVPLDSNIVIRTACCTVGVGLPIYSTYKAIETKDQDEQRKWLLYWAVYGSFSVGERFADKFISWFPLYYHMKLAFLVWLQLPTTNVSNPLLNVGAKQLYTNYSLLSNIFHSFMPSMRTVLIPSESSKHTLHRIIIRPFGYIYLRHQARLDQ
ncbi:HVA22-like protein k, partial [Tanacetum coccineum]